MCLSFIMVMLMPGAVFYMIKAAPGFLKYMKWIKNKAKQDKFKIEEGEQPLLVLEYNTRLNCFVAVLSMILLVGVLFNFHFASSWAREDATYGGSFFSLSKEYTYILYCFAWNFDSVFLLMILSLVFINLFNKRVLFFKKGIITENGLTGSKNIPLSGHVWLVRSPSLRKYWLYDEINEVKKMIFNRLYMRLDAHKAQLLNEFLSKIPEKKKTFYF